MDRSAQQWLEWITSRADSEKPRVSRLRAYASSKPPMPDMGPRLKKSWLRFQDRARTNFAGLIVDSLVNRIQPNGIVIGGDPNSALSSQAGRIWRDNRMDVAVADAVRDACTLGTGYLLVTRDENGKAVITRERPEQFFALPDPVHPWRALAAVKVWRDSTQETDYLRLWADGSLMEYSRPSFTQFGSAREYVETFTGKWVFQAVSPCDGVPVVLLDNKDRAGEFEYHLPLLDRIHWGILQRLVLTSLQTFRQRALRSSSPDAPGLAETDEDGNDIDYARIFEPGPGALWELPPGIEIWESQTSDIRPLLEAVKDDIRTLSAETHTPVSSMLPDSANQSAAGAEAPMQALVFKAQDRINRFKPALAVCLVKALQIENAPLGEQTLEVLFAPPAMVTLAERYDAATKAKAAGEALETIQRNILGYSPDQIAQDKKRRAEEAIALAAGISAAKPPPEDKTPPEEPAQT